MKENNKKIDVKAAKAKIADAKKEAKKYTTPEDVKKFLDANKGKLDAISRKLDGDVKDNFDKIVKIADDYSKSMNESIDPRWVAGIIAFLFWIIGLGPVWVVAAASPIVGPLLSSLIEKVMAK